MNPYFNKSLHRLQVLKRLTLKYVFKLFGRANTLLQAEEKFFIKKGYHHATNAGIFNDTANTDEWQKEVYQYAADFMTQHHYRQLIDVGCGSGYKLIKYLGEFDTTGIEVEQTYRWLKGTYPSRKWLPIAPIADDLKTNLVICVDVIEHLPDPDTLIHFIRSIQSEYILFSTPERDIVAGKNDYGPPENSTHYREWNAGEFKNYLSEWFDVEEQKVFSGRSASQLALCRTSDNKKRARIDIQPDLKSNIL